METKSKSFIDKYDIRIAMSVILAVVAYLIARLFGYLGFALIGAGHGSGVFGYLFYSPVVGIPGAHHYLGLVIWPCIGFLLPWSRSIVASCLILLLMGICYCGLARDIFADFRESGTTSYAEKVIKEVPDIVCVIVSVYVLIQIAIIGSLIYFRTRKSAKIEIQSSCR